jgi:alanyl aminopeptidase
MSIPGSIVTVKGRTAFAAEAARQMPPLVAALETYFGRPFPYPKCDLLAVPEFYAGAMENAGAITFREEILLLDSKSATPRQRARMAGTIAHELAHMWFGDLVTLAWWDDVWLNESFASWLGDKVTNQVFPEFGERVRQVRDVQRALFTDARPSTRPIRGLGAKGDLPLDRLFDPLAYQKGQAVLQMFESWIGPDLFRQGVQSYIQAHEWGNATGSDLWRALSHAAGRDMSGPLSGFIEQPGVPLVTAEVQADGRIKLTQSRFHNYGATVEPAKWQIPILLKYEANGQARTKWVMLNETEQMVALPDGARPAWVDPNGSETGYYRWSVPGAMLVQMAESASRVLDARERLGYLANVSALLDAGLVRGDEYLRILSQFSGDTEPEVGQSLLEGLYKVREVFVEEGDREAFAAYVQRTLSPILARIGRLPQADEKDGVTTLRPALITWLGDDGHDASIQTWADSLGRAYRARPESIPSSLVDVAIQLPASRGDASLFSEYRAHLASAHLPVDRARWLTGLGSFRSSAAMDSVLAFALHGPLRPQERGTITRTLLERKENYPALYSWMTANYDAIIAATTPTAAAFMPFYAGGCSAERLAQAKEFFSQPAHARPGVRQSLAQVTDAVNDCVGLREREGAPVQAFLKQVATAK